MNKKKLWNYLINEHNECFEISGYWFPEMIYCTSGKTKVLDVKKFRKSQLNFISEYEEAFIQIISGSNEICLREFPIPIFDKKLWNVLCRINSGLNPSILNKSIISLDFFFPYRNLVIEIDGIQHLEDPVQRTDDTIRDEYLRRKYGLNIIRLSQFTVSGYWKLQDIDYLAPLNSIPAIFSKWEEDIIESWKLLHSQDIKSLDYIDKNFTPRIADKVISLSPSATIQVFMQRLTKKEKQYFENLFLKLYEKKLSIP